MALSPDQRASLKQKLEKKQTFKAGVQELTVSISNIDLGDRGSAQLVEMMGLVIRVHQLLKTRHTSIDFWRAGRELFRTCAVSHGTHA